MIIRREMLLAALAAATSEDKRYFLDGVYAEPVNHRVVATNGHVLLMATDRHPQDDADFPIVPGAPYSTDPAPILIPSTTAKAMIATMPKKRVLDILQCAQLSANGSEDTATLAATDLAAPRIAVLSRNDSGTYPQYEHVIPPADRPEIKLAMRVDVLQAIINAAVAVEPTKGKHGTPAVITFGIPKPDADSDVVLTAITIAVSSDDIELTGVAMPCRV